MRFSSNTISLSVKVHLECIFHDFLYLFDRLIRLEILFTHQLAYLITCSSSFRNDRVITAVLHTWGQKLHHHPHLHFVVSGGGLSPIGKAKRLKLCRLLTGTKLKESDATVLDRLKTILSQDFNLCPCYSTFRKSFILVCR